MNKSRIRIFVNKGINKPTQTPCYWWETNLDLATRWYSRIRFY